jgi:glycosyltransferase involved in cell wall biosynthesis
MAKDTIGLVFRPSALGGKSVEEIFSGMLRYWQGKMNINTFEDNLHSSARHNGRQLKRRNYTLYHFTGGAHRLLYFLRGRNILLTVHDIGRLKELHGLRCAAYFFLVLYFPLKIATRISTVSEYSKKDLLHYFPFLANKPVHVIYNPLPGIFRPRNKQFNSAHPRILLVGTQPHKNNARVIEAVKDIPCTLVLIGKLDTSLLGWLKLQKVAYESYPELTYEQVYEQYCRSDMLVFASLHEGFGMPIIEAQAVGRPVIASRIPPHEEVAGDSVVYVHPENTSEIHQAILTLLENATLRDQLIAKGNENIRRFELQRIAGQYESLYKDMLQRAQ